MAELAYLDESYDSSTFTMVALLIPDHAWDAAFRRVRKARALLKTKYGIFTSKELHTTDFVAGRGRIAPKPIPKGLRAEIYRKYFEFIPTIPGIRIIGGCWPNERNQADMYAYAFGRIQDRLQKRSVVNDHQTIIVSDEGQEHEITRAARRAHIFNPVGSKFSAWDDGSTWRNIPTDRIIEDPIFKPSHRSYFLQLADFVAFALLKRETAIPNERATKEGFDGLYESLLPVLATEASGADELGIVRS